MAAKKKKTSTVKKKSSPAKKTKAKAKASKKATPTKTLHSTTTTPAKTESNRSEHRIPINLLVDYRANGHYLFDFCKDLNAGGVFIETKTPLPTGSSIDLTFTIPDSKETLEANGQVIWVQQEIDGREDLTPGMGVQFSQFGSQQRSMLEGFVKRYSPEADRKSFQGNKSA